MVWKIRATLFLLVFGVFLAVTVVASAAQESPSVAETGAYQVGVQILDLIDESRDDEEFEAYIWYPALVSDGASRPFPPDDSAAPYPLVIYSHGYTGATTEAANVFIQHLVSHGFIVAGLMHHDTNEAWRALVDRPLDVLFLIDYLTELSDSPLAGLMDMDNIGVAGYSFGGYTSMVMAGARVNQPSFTGWCAAHAEESVVDAFYCGLTPDWDELNAYRDQFMTASGGDLWPAISDVRIRAVFTVAPCFGQLFGEEGLAEVAVPVFIVAGTTDEACLYDRDTAYYYHQLTASDHYLLTLDNRSHAAVMRERDLLSHYAAAFFGYYLQGVNDYTKYLSPESAAAFRDAALESQIEE